MNDKISVIVPVYNVERYLEKCINSIIKQSYYKLEIILVDDGSSDLSPQICDNWASKDKRIKVIHKKNGGLADARNVALDVATGEYIAFVDSDDWIDTNMFTEMVQHMSECVDIVCAPLIKEKNCEVREVVFGYYDDKIIPSKEVTRRVLIDEIGSQVVIGLYKRVCWNDIRFPVGRLYEDMATTYLVYNNSKSIYFLKKPFYHYRMNPDSISFSSNPVVPYHIFLGMRSHYEFAQKYFPEVLEICLAKTMHYAISTVFNYQNGRPLVLEEAMKDVEDFLNKNKKGKRDMSVIPISRRLALKVYFISPILFQKLSYCIHKYNRRKCKKG